MKVKHMVFWRKKDNQKAQDEEQRDEKLLHPEGAPEIEPSTDYESEMDHDTKHDLQETEHELMEELDEEPVPYHTALDDTKEDEELSDHTQEGGWLSRLTGGLKKSSSKFTQGLSDFVTKRKLDEETLEELEELLIEADLGPKTAAKIIEDFSRDRFGKEVDDNEIKEALAESMTKFLDPVAVPFVVKKPANGPYVVLVCGVNGAGKTTTIGKFAHQLKFEQGLNVALAAGDTFRAAAVEQLKEWSKRVGCVFISKEEGADSAAVAYEAYEQAKSEGVDVLFIDTAGRLQNKKNLMAELEKIIRVLKKQDETIPHATLLVLDATTGQNAFSQLETFKEMVNVTGLIVTKLDGSAKGGVLVGLADQFKTPVHAIGVGEGIEDLQPFTAKLYARSLVGLE